MNIGSSVIELIKKYENKMFYSRFICDEQKEVVRSYVNYDFRNYLEESLILGFILMAKPYAE